MAHGITLSHVPGISARGGEAVRKQSLFSRIVDAFVAAQQRRAEKEIEKYIESHGGKFTDQLEREIEHTFSRY